MKHAPALDRIAALDAETGCVNVVVETPKGSTSASPTTSGPSCSTIEAFFIDYAESASSRCDAVVRITR
jgi:hypothetical protein